MMNPANCPQCDGEVMIYLKFEPYNVTCARCGRVLSCTDAMLEEGDEWKCMPCWVRENERERKLYAEKTAST